MEIQIVCTTVHNSLLFCSAVFYFHSGVHQNQMICHLMLTNKILVAGWIFHIFSMFLMFVIIFYSKKNSRSCRSCKLNPPDEIRKPRPVAVLLSLFKFIKKVDGFNDFNGRLATSLPANIFGNDTIYRHDKKPKRAKTPEINQINRAPCCCWRAAGEELQLLSIITPLFARNRN